MLLFTIGAYKFVIYIKFLFYMKTSQLFVNLPVKDVKHAKDFFERLGFQFQESFTNDISACIEINDNAFVMLLSEKFFDTFTKTEMVNAHTQNEVLVAISMPSKDKVNEVVDRAIELGAKEARTPQEHAHMYGRSFHDLDGHVWEIYYMNIN